MKPQTTLSLSKSLAYRAALLSSFGLAAAALPLQAQTISFTPLGDLSGTPATYNSTAFGVSSGGVAVGGGVSGSGPEAFYGSTPPILGLGDLSGGAFNSSALGISSDGSTIVGFGTTGTGNEAFRTVGGVLTGMGLRPGGLFSRALAASANGGVIVGVADATGTSPLGEGFIWNGSYTGLGSLVSGGASEARSVSGDGTVVVGQSDSTGSFITEAFRWTSGGGMVGLGDLPGGLDWSQANDISANGLVIVGYGNSASGQEAFRWTSGGGMVGLGDLAGGLFSSVAHSVNADGSVIVGRADDGANAAFYWTSSSGMVKLQDILGAAVPAGWTLTEAFAVSDDGYTIAGVAFNAAGGTEAWIATVPEPSSVGLAAVGALAFGAFIVRRRNRA
jgi:probable HAF family extracellular repeat protein